MAGTHESGGARITVGPGDGSLELNLHISVLIQRHNSNSALKKIRRKNFEKNKNHLHIRSCR